MMSDTADMSDFGDLGGVVEGDVVAEVVVDDVGDGWRVNCLMSASECTPSMIQAGGRSWSRDTGREHPQPDTRTPRQWRSTLLVPYEGAVMEWWQETQERIEAEDVLGPVALVEDIPIERVRMAAELTRAAHTALYSEREPDVSDVCEVSRVVVDVGHAHHVVVRVMRVTQDVGGAFLHLRVTAGDRLLGRSSSVFVTPREVRGDDV